MKSEGWSQPIERAAERSIEASRRINRTTALLCPLRVHLSGTALRAVTCKSVSGGGRVASIGIDPAGFSGHSLRAGFATSAVQAGVSTLKIRAQTEHASDALLARKWPRTSEDKRSSRRNTSFSSGR